MFFHGKGVAQDIPTALHWYRVAAQSGYTLAMNTLGHFYDTGEGVEQDFYEAFRWYKMAAEAGDDCGQNNLGTASDRTNERTKVAFAHVREQMEWNCAGCLYNNGEGVEQNCIEAMKWYRLAAVQGNTSALNNIGLSYEYGLGVPKNLKEAVKWYMKAAKAGHPQLPAVLNDIFTGIIHSSIHPSR